MLHEDIFNFLDITKTFLENKCNQVCIISIHYIQDEFIEDVSIIKTMTFQLRCSYINLNKIWVGKIDHA
jgi:hypothetical protein